MLLRDNETVSEDAINFFVSIIILHEITHLGDFLYNGDMYDGEEGNDFELFVTGLYQESPNNAEIMLQNYRLKIRQ